MKKFILILKIFLLIIFIAAIMNWNNITFKTINKSEIDNINLEILQLFSTDHDINICISTNNKDSISSVLKIEDFIRRNDKICILQRTQHWKIIITYNLNNGKSIQRIYEGQNFREELCKNVLTIKEVEEALD